MANWKNPNGPVGYRSPGRRATSDSLNRSFGPKVPLKCADDPVYRTLASRVARTVAKMLGFRVERGQKYLRRQAELKVQEAQVALENRRRDVLGEAR